jgi:hypothetical protein
VRWGDGSADAHSTSLDERSTAGVSAPAFGRGLAITVGRADLREGRASQCGLAPWQLKWWLAQVRRIFSFRRPIGTDPPALGPRIGLHGQSTNDHVVRGTNGVGHSHAFMQAQPVWAILLKEQVRGPCGLRPPQALQGHSILRRESVAQFSRCQV